MGAVRGTSREKLYQKLGFESLQQRRWYRKLCCLFKKSTTNHRVIFFNLRESIPQLWTKHNLFKTSFFLSTLKEWNNLDPEIRKSKSISIFKRYVLNFIRHKPNNVYYCYNFKGIRLITRLRQRLSHLREHKFKHSFQDCLNLICFCGNDIETSTHYLLHCLTYTNERMALLDKVRSILLAF